MSTPPLEKSFEDRLSLRERKKLKTRRSIQEHALRLFKEQGYDATTVEQIAAAAEVSPSTFFRYFPTKEDTVLTDEYDSLIKDALREQPPEATPAVAVRNVMREMVGAMMADDRQRVLDRARLLLSVTSLRSRQLDHMKETQQVLTRAIAERLDRPADDFEVAAFCAAVIAVWEMTVLSWLDGGGEQNLAERLDQAVDFLVAGCPL